MTNKETKSLAEIINVLQELRDALDENRNSKRISEVTKTVEIAFRSLEGARFLLSCYKKKYGCDDHVDEVLGYIRQNINQSVPSHPAIWWALAKEGVIRELRRWQKADDETYLEINFDTKVIKIGGDDPYRPTAPKIWDFLRQLRNRFKSGNALPVENDEDSYKSAVTMLKREPPRGIGKENFKKLIYHDGVGYLLKSSVIRTHRQKRY